MSPSLIQSRIKSLALWYNSVAHNRKIITYANYSYTIYILLFKKIKILKKR